MGCNNTITYNQEADPCGGSQHETTCIIEKSALTQLGLTADSTQSEVNAAIQNALITLNTKLVYQEDTVGTRLTDADVSGSYNLDWNGYKLFELTMTADSTFVDVNLPSSAFIKSIKIILTGVFIPTFPLYWEAFPSNDAYDGSKRNYLEIICINGTSGSEDIIYKLQNLN